MAEQNMSPGRQLRAVIDNGVAVMPGAFNALSAMSIERAGFEGVYISGAGLSNTVAGLPDAVAVQASCRRQKCRVKPATSAGGVRPAAMARIRTRSVSSRLPSPIASHKDSSIAVPASAVAASTSAKIGRAHV